MIKRLVIDLDNTIILWKDEYTSALKKVMQEYNLDIDYKIIDDIIESQEKKYKNITKEQLLLDINNECKINLGMDFIDKLLEYQKDLAPEKDEKLIDLFAYLNSKYELVLLTNYYTETQVGRLKKLGIDIYFNEFYGGDIITLKPDPKAFYKAIGKNKPEECIMIGDSIEYDINGALNIGMNVILVDLLDKIKEKKEYKIIKDLYELKNIL